MTEEIEVLPAMEERDGQLVNCNETELLAMALKQGLGRLKKGIDHQELVEIVRGERPCEPKYQSDTVQTRQMLQDFINANWGQLRSQLPGCNGQCTTFPCTDGKHALCLFPNKALLR